jgi:ABC-type transport system involved in multi-copper enzyme maturation permease subunit
MERTVRSYLLPALGYFVVLELMLIAAIYYWPDFRENVGTFRNMAPAALKGLVDAFGSGGVSSYVNGQHFFKGCNTLGTAAAVLFSMGAVAGEAHRGTLEIWLARPFTRRRLLLERWIAGALALCIPVFITSATIPKLLAMHGETMEYSDLMLCSVQQSLLLLIIYSITFLWSVHSSRPARLALVMLFASTMQFALYLVKGITHFSLYRLSDLNVYSKILLRNELDLALVLPMVAVIGILLALSLRGFARRTP